MIPLLDLDNTLVELGEPIILELHFKSLRDEDIPIGQIIILWNKIIACKIGENLYEVYDPKPIEIKLQPTLFDTVNRTSFRDYLMNAEDYIPNARLKFRKEYKRNKRIKPWESPKVYF